MNSIAQARCERVSMEAGDIKVFTLRIQGTEDEFLNKLRPGRHIAIRYPDTSGALQQRLYSITGRRNANVFEIAVKRSGRRSVSDHMHATLHEGSTISLGYVAGDITIESVANLERLGMVAGGIGITLPIALLREIADRARRGRQVPKTVLVLCIPKISDIPFLHELLELNLTSMWFTLHVFVTRESIHARDHFNPGRPTLESLSIMGQPQAVVICGSHRFAQTFREHASSLFPSASLLIESFTPPEPQACQGHEGTERSVRLSLADSEEVIEASSGKSLLEILESYGAPVRSQCRAGICGDCRVRVSGGECRFEPDFCLSEKDKISGYALACCTFPLSGDIAVEFKAAT
ncbi:MULTISPECIES: 2Fe-2S iron-sulfur cluster-binding protein [Burkholderia]|uniref:2Fe-2S iron-sulfur cluster-binding protein n=1 Tax=Burkholderia TaxID=32008 RepID=UPI00128D7E81|nr:MULTISPECIES: 2Fe-2S iron-sulfur cluster-binding protein [Burkholderia]MPV67159.1 2Fe-2S iron-sulfur cluster binding domain-containing protein [Burkholderia sp. BE17]UVE69385.1 2Fe-2S iron-sulfur cluster-binding protein [Burkholderia pyrrocinia]